MTTISSTDLTAIANKARTERGNQVASTKSKISTYTAQLCGWESSLQYLLAEAQDARLLAASDEVQHRRAERHKLRRMGLMYGRRITPIPLPG